MERQTLKEREGGNTGSRDHTSSFNHVCTLLFYPSIPTIDCTLTVISNNKSLFQFSTVYYIIELWTVFKAEVNISYSKKLQIEFPPYWQQHYSPICVMPPQLTSQLRYQKDWASLLKYSVDYSSLTKMRWAVDIVTLSIPGRVGKKLEVKVTERLVGWLGGQLTFVVCSRLVQVSNSFVVVHITEVIVFLW